jgi:hypothetical protein
MNIKIKPFSKIDINTFFFYDVEDIEKAYRICSQLGKQAKNINAGGNEIEQAANSFLTKRLPTKYFVTSGHITDSRTK